MLTPSPEQEQSLRTELDVLRNRVYDAQEILDAAIQERAVVMNALKTIVDQRRVA